MQTKGDIAAIRYNLGERIRLLRTEQEVSQRAFAEMIDMNRSYVIGIEKGKRNVSVDNLTKIARGLGVSLSQLFEDVDSETSVANRLLLMEELLEEQEDATMESVES